MSWNTFTFVLIILATLSHKDVTEWTPLTIPLTDHGFKKIAEQDGIIVYQHDDSNIINLGAEATFPVSPEKMEKVLLDYENQVGKIPRLAESKLLATGHNWKVVYQRLHLPIINDRDFILDVSWGRDGDISWIVFRATHHRGLSPVKGVVRLTHHQGSWQFKPSADRRSTFVRYQMSMDLSGWIPRWMGRSQSGKDLIELFRAIKKMALSPDHWRK